MARMNGHVVMTRLLIGMQAVDLAGWIGPGTPWHSVRRRSAVLVADAGLGLQAGQPQILLDLRNQQVDVARQERVRLRSFRHTDQIGRFFGTRHPRGNSVVVAKTQERIPRVKHSVADASLVEDERKRRASTCYCCAISLLATDVCIFFSTPSSALLLLPFLLQLCCLYLVKRSSSNTIPIRMGRIAASLFSSGGTKPPVVITEKEYKATFSPVNEETWTVRDILLSSHGGRIPRSFSDPRGR